MAKSLEKEKSGSLAPSLSDVNTLREQAREHIRQGPVTAAYGLDPLESIRVLNQALATELVCVLRYKHHAFAAEGLHSKYVVEEFEEHAREEMDHADQIAKRIKQLGGTPDFNPETLIQRSHSEYVECETLIEMIREDLIAERIAIESYTEMVRFFGDKDPTSRRLMEKVLRNEEEHADELVGLLLTIDPEAKPADRFSDENDEQEQPAYSLRNGGGISRLRSRSKP